VPVWGSISHIKRFGLAFWAEKDCCVEDKEALIATIPPYLRTSNLVIKNSLRFVFAKVLNNRNI